MPKRRPARDIVEEDTPVQKKVRRSVRENDESINTSSPTQVTETPSGRKSILKSTPSKANEPRSVHATPSSLRKVLFTTPSKATDNSKAEGEDTPTAARNDRSAYRKSQRALQSRATDVDDSDVLEDDDDQEIAETILDEDNENQDEEADEIVVDKSRLAATPPKIGKPRGRPKGRRKERTPSPPPDLPPHEVYFFQNRTGANKTSSNTLPANLLLNHDDYFAQTAKHDDAHAADIQRLKRLHKRGFDQWLFELEEGFNICLYGYGSKRQMAMEFVEHLYSENGEATRIIVANAYTPGFTIRDVLSNLVSVALPRSAKLPAQPGPMLEALLAEMSEANLKHKIFLVIHSLDHVNLRKGTSQSTIARLAAHPDVSIIATCDTPNFPLLWDVSLSKRLRFLYHDATTFDPYRAETDVVEEVNTLLGRNGRRFGGKDGVGYVLKSLPENARSLFRILVEQQLALVDSEGGDSLEHVLGDDSEPEDFIGLADEDDAIAAAAAAEQRTPTRRGRPRAKGSTKKATGVTQATNAAAPIGVEYRTLYHKAVEEFICSSEVNFRTLLKEFHDHQMIDSRKDALGTERLLVPFRREELEAILEELV